ncbi:MAG: TonB-dependent receptor [Gammaproteobacteria bacterium]|nr:TonB-dependent receptor [Gammaproteobacteria bacterium]
MRGCFANFRLTAMAVAVAAAAGAANAQNSGLEEIVITAERRDVSVQDIPLSVVALSGQTLDKRGVKTFEELQYQVPSVTFTDNGNTKYVNIRGIGVSESAPNQTVGVAVHLDGAYVAREFVFGDAFFDLESVEVLRGPQGTYSGQNAAGGAIFINSRKPVIGETEGFANVEFGNYGEKRLGAGVSFTLTETLAARISGEWERRDSFYENHGPELISDPDSIEDQPGNLDRSFGRFQLLFQPNDDFEARLIYEMSSVKTDGVPYKDFAAPGTNMLPATGVRELNYDLDGHRNVSYDRVTMTMDWAATDAFKVLGNISYLASHQHYLDDGDNNSVFTTNAVQAGADYTIDDKYYTAELNLVSTLDGPFDWTVGASYLNYQQDNFLNFLRYNHPSFPGTGLDETIHTRLYFYLDNVRRNKAIFGEIGYQLTDAFQVKLGLRYNDDTVGFDDSSYSSGGPFPAGRPSHYNAPSGAALPASDLLGFDAFTGRVFLKYETDDVGMFYGTVSRGYKPGGTTPFANEYESEKVTNFEAGWKGNLFDDMLSVSLSAYYMKYDNFQRTYRPDPDNPAASVTNNVDGSKVKGLELQLNGHFSDFLWDVSFAYNDGEYGDLLLVLPARAADGVNPTVPTPFNLKGEPIDYLPETAVNFGLSYDGWHINGGQLVPSVRVSYQDEYYTTFYHFDQNLIPSKTIVDLFLRYESERNWTAELYAKNVADKDYISRASAGDSGLGQYLMGNPRQYGVKVGYRF